MHLLRWVSDPSTCFFVILLTTLLSYRTVSPALNIEQPILSLIKTFAHESFLTEIPASPKRLEVYCKKEAILGCS